MEYILYRIFICIYMVIWNFIDKIILAMKFLYVILYGIFIRKIILAMYSRNFCWLTYTFFASSITTVFISYIIVM